MCLWFREPGIRGEAAECIGCLTHCLYTIYENNMLRETLYTHFHTVSELRWQKKTGTHTHTHTHTGWMMKHGSREQKQSPETWVLRQGFADTHAGLTVCICVRVSFHSDCVYANATFWPVASGMLTVAYCRFVLRVDVQYRLQRQQSCVWCCERRSHRAFTHLRQIGQQSAQYPHVFDDRLIISVVFQEKISKMCRFLLLKCKNLLLFFVNYDRRWRFFEL